MRMHRVAPRTIGMTPFAMLLVVSAGYAQNLILNPQEISENAKNVRLRVQRADGRPFTTKPKAVLSVGIAFGTKLVMFEAKPDRTQSPQSLTVILRDTEATWSPAPRAGDNLLVAVYLDMRPCTTATPLHVVGSSRSNSLLTCRLAPTTARGENHIRPVVEKP